MHYLHNLCTDIIDVEGSVNVMNTDLCSASSIIKKNSKYSLVAVAFSLRSTLIEQNYDKEHSSNDRFCFSFKKAVWVKKDLVAISGTPLYCTVKTPHRLKCIVSMLGIDLFNI